MNYMFTFENEKCEKVTETIDLREVLSLTSQLKKAEEMISNSFFIVTKFHDFAFCSSDITEKWSWIVTLERIMDFRERGTSNYNSMDKIKTMGFESQE